MQSHASLASEFAKAHKAVIVVLISVVLFCSCVLGCGLAGMVTAIILMQLLFAAHENIKIMLSPKGHLPR